MDPHPKHLKEPPNTGVYGDLTVYVDRKQRNKDCKGDNSVCDLCLSPLDSQGTKILLATQVVRYFVKFVNKDTRVIKIYMYPQLNL